MSKNNLSENKNQGASASRSKSTQKDLDTERRFIDDFMTEHREFLHSLYRVVVLTSWHTGDALRTATQ